MKVIARVTLYPGPVAPGDVIDIRDKDEALSLIERGLAAPMQRPPREASAPATPPAPLPGQAPGGASATPPASPQATTTD